MACTTSTPDIEDIQSGLGVLTIIIRKNELGWDDSEFSVFTPTPEDVEGTTLSITESLESMPKPVIIEPKTSEYAPCKSNLSAESPEFIPKSVCARNESVRKADNPRN
ncbi:hypothetical protein Tco_0291203 [Tanacetum coccineum]